MAKSYFDFKEYSKWVEKLGITKTEFKIWLKTFLLSSLAADFWSFFENVELNLSVVEFLSV